MSIDSNIVTAIIAIVALISPNITAIINNRYNLKLQKMNTYYSRQSQALDDFIKFSLNYYGDGLSWGQMTSYTNALNNLYIYFDKLDDSLFLKLDEYRQNKQLKEYKKTLNLIVKKLSKEIVSL